MASPQLTGGYTRISNELIQALIKYITNPTWLRISLIIIRITYGFHRKETVTNYKSFTTMLNLTEDYIKQSLSEMEQQKIVQYKPTDGRKFRISLNKDYEKWKVRK